MATEQCCRYKVEKAGFNQLINDAFENSCHTDHGI
jgi:hypothetical protein